MKTKINNSSASRREEKDKSPTINEYKLQADRIRKILDEAIYKLKILKVLPRILENDGAILRQFLNKTEADYILLMCHETDFTKQLIETRSDLLLISNRLDRINMFQGGKAGIITMKKNKNFAGGDNYEIHVAYAVDLIFKCPPLIEYMESLNEEEDSSLSLITTFIESMIKLKTIADNRLNVTADEEIKRDNDLKTAYRASMMLSDNIQELEDLLEKQRQELGKEHDRKQAILEDLAEKISELKEKAEDEIHNIVYDSEMYMMKDYNKSIELQAELAEEAKESTHNYQTLLEEHIAEEKALRAKRLKVETQLASWVAKYDQDMGEKQAEYDKLEQTYNDEKDLYEELEEKIREQEEEYLMLMDEKEAEETRIREEIAWNFLQNRAARRIQRYWRAYRARKLARKRGRKGKKKGSAGKKGSGKKGSAKGKKGKKPIKEEPQTTLRGGPDPNALIESKFDSELLSDIKQEDAFTKQEVTVDLNET